MEVLEMYRKFCLANNWKFEASVNEGDLAGTESGKICTLFAQFLLGACREASAIVEGPGVYSSLRFEGGVHR